VNQAWDKVKDKVGPSPRKGALMEIQEENEEHHDYESPEKAIMDAESSFEASESPSPAKSSSPTKENVPSVCQGLVVSDL